MKHEQPAYRRVGIVAKPTGALAGRVLRKTVGALSRHGIQPILDQEAAALAGGGKRGLARKELARQVDAVIVIGGDGTFLSVARTVGPQGPPLVGINLGSLGFLTEIHRKEIDTAIDAVLQGQATEEKRLMLSVKVRRNGRLQGSYKALNDVVLAKSALARTIRLKVEVDGQAVTSYRSDGLIVASPTGSTAYSLAAGGPLVHPGIQALILTPICPHALSNRPLLIPLRSLITVSRPSMGEAIDLTVDGQVGGPLEINDRVEVRRSRISLRLLRPFPRTFYETLRTKLNWR
ncbi:MAG: NAD(+)/NADH kinase [Acidobacteriota bacterium]